MDIIKKRFGEQLKTLRKVKNYTQQSLAKEIGINLRQLARIEAGESFVSSDTLYKICKILNISPKNLFNFDIQEEIKTNSNTPLTNNFELLKEKLGKIVDDKKKLEYMNLAFESLYNKEALNELKFLIKGIELTQG